MEALEVSLESCKQVVYLVGMGKGAGSRLRDEAFVQEEEALVDVVREGLSVRRVWREVEETNEIGFEFQEFLLQVCVWACHLCRGGGVASGLPPYQ